MYYQVGHSCEQLVLDHIGHSEKSHEMCINISHPRIEKGDHLFKSSNFI